MVKSFITQPRDLIRLLPITVVFTMTLENLNLYNYTKSHEFNNNDNDENWVNIGHP